MKSDHATEAPVGAAVNDERQQTSAFRMALPQVIACSVKNLLLIDLGLAVAFSTIVIPALRSTPSDRDEHHLHFTPVQTSWFGSVVFLTQPLGAIASGWVTEAIGRKRAMMLVTVPHLIAWLMFFFAGTVSEMFVAGVLLGLGVGLMESPILTYVGEISHPSLRGILLAFSHVTVIGGMCLMYVIGSLTTWRWAAVLSAICPCVTVVALMFIPETPHWLLQHRRPDDALASLQWLRGWVQPPAVQKEFNDLINYVRTSNACLPCQRSGSQCSHRTGCLSKATELWNGNVLRPFGLVVMCFVIVQSNGIAAIKPFLVQVFQIFGVPMNANWASVLVGGMDVLANITCMVAIRLLGKRVMCLLAVFGSGVCCFILTVNAYLTIPAGANSFYPQADMGLIETNNTTALVVFVFLAYFAGVSHSVAWMYVSEVFPIRVRGLASGCSAATGYFVVFVFTKTFYSLEMECSMWGAFLLYGCMTTIGFIIQLYVLPDTEGHTLEEIEEFFSDSTRTFSDRRILRSSVNTVNGAYAGPKDGGADAGVPRRRPTPAHTVDFGGAVAAVPMANDGPPTMRFDNRAFV